MTQLSSTASTCAGQWKMWLLKVFSVIYFTACAAEPNDGSTTPGHVTPTTFEPPVPFLQLHSKWTDVFPSEKVELSCSVAGSSDWTFTWYKNAQELQDQDPNVSLSAEGSKLTITAATKTYSGSYSCKAYQKTKSVTTKSSNSVELTVSANKPKPTLTRSSNFDKMFPGESVTFTCKVDVSSGWDYLWYHKGTDEIQAHNNSTYTIASIDHPNSGQYHCKAKRGKDPFYTEESDTTALQVSDPPKPSLELRSSWPDVFKNETLEFSCEVHSTDWTITWYRNQNDLNLDEWDSYSLLNITEVTQADEGGYACKAHLKSRSVSSGFSNTVIVTVYENIPEPTVNKVPDFNPMYVGETVNIKCNVDVSSGWKYQWYKDGNELGATNETNSIYLALSDQGKYWCKATRGEIISTDFSEEIQQDVLEIPIPSLKLITSWDDVFPTESVKLSCGMDGSPNWIYTWYKDGQEVQAGNVVSVDSNGATLSIRSASAEHTGPYNCKGHLNNRSVRSNLSSGLTLNVYANKPKPTLTRSSNFDKMFPGESVTFTCKVDVSSGWVYLWYHKGTDEIQAHNNSTYTIASIDHPNSGQYHCKAKRGKDPFYTEESDTTALQVSEIPIPSLKLITSWVDVFPTESVKLSCGMDGSPNWIYTWYKDGQEVQAGSVVSADSNGATLSIRSASAEHTGPYNCKGHLNNRPVRSNLSSELTLNVYANKPKPTLTRSSNFDKMFPGESVTFTCKVDVSSGWVYLWYHKGTDEIQAHNNSTYTIASIDHPNSGQYHCKAKRGKDPFYTEESDTTALQVSDPPKPSLELRSSWPDVFENEMLEFSCEVHSTDWTITWYRNQKELMDDLNLDEWDSLLNITEVTQADEGGYACKAHLESRSVSSGFSNTVIVTVYENIPKPTVNKVPDFNPMYVGETVNIKCNVDVSSGWKYQWYKDGNELGATNETNSIYLALSDQGKYWCKATRGEIISTDSSKEIQQDVLEIPIPSLKLITSWDDVFPTESVKLSCVIDGSPNWIYTWYKDGQEVQAGNVVSVDSNGATLSIRSASAEHTGPYNCKGHLNNRSVRSNLSSGLTLNVYDTKPRVTLMQNPIHNVMHTEDSVSFSCHINVSSGWEYLWHQDGRLLPETGNNHAIKSVAIKNTGSYQCQAKRGKDTVFSSDQSHSVRLKIEERPQADIILLTGWSEVFSTDSLVLRCGVQESQDKWNYTWFKEGQPINLTPSEKQTVTPQNDPEQSQYTCQGIRTGIPSYSRSSDSFKTKNLLLKRRVLLSISGCIFFGIIAVFLGCIILRVIRKPADGEEKPEEGELFLTMAQLKERDDAPCPLVQYITDAELNASSKEADENGTICSETTPLPITVQEDQVVTSESQDATEKNGGLVSFK